MVTALARCLSQTLTISTQSAARRCVLKPLPTISGAQVRNFSTTTPLQTKVASRQSAKSEQTLQDEHTSWLAILNLQTFQQAKEYEARALLRSRSFHLTKSVGAAKLFLALFKQNTFSLIYSDYVAKLQYLAVAERGAQKYFKDVERQLSQDTESLKRGWNEQALQVVTALAERFLENSHSEINTMPEAKARPIKLAAESAVLFACRSLSKDVSSLSAEQCRTLSSLISCAIKVSPKRSGALTVIVKVTNPETELNLFP